jgi:hypothetical protein
VDLAEHAAPAEHVAHAASCEKCRTQVDALRDVLRLAASDPVPEPSPLFWERFSARVSAAVRQEAAPGSPRRAWAWAWRWAPITTLAVLVLAVGIGTSMWKGLPRTGPAPAVPAPVLADTDGELLLQDDASWNLMTALSSDVVFDDEASTNLASVPGLADRALQQLTEPERVELAKILREEMAQPASAGPKGESD